MKITSQKRKKKINNSTRNNLGELEHIYKRVPLHKKELS